MGGGGGAYLFGACRDHSTLRGERRVNAQAKFKQAKAFSKAVLCGGSIDTRASACRREEAEGGGVLSLCIAVVV